MAAAASTKPFNWLEYHLNRAKIIAKNVGEKGRILWNSKEHKEVKIDELQSSRWILEWAQKAQKVFSESKLSMPDIDLITSAKNALESLSEKNTVLEEDGNSYSKFITETAQNYLEAANFLGDVQII